MAHHVVENAAALQCALPEPRHMWPAVFFSRAREIGATGKRSSPRPDQILAARNVWCEELILEITGIQLYTCGELRHFLRFADIAREWFLACETEQRRAVAHRADDLLDVLDARVVGSAQPDCVDRGVGDHFSDRSECARVTNFRFSRVRGRCPCMLCVGTPDSANVGVANSGESLNVKTRVEAAADESDA